MTTYAPHPHNTAVLALVRAAWALVGDAQAPAGLTYDAKGLLISAYAVVYPIGSATFDGSLDGSDGQGDAWPITQVTYVGRTREQADALRSKVREQLLGQAVTVNGRRVGPVELDVELAVTRDDDVRPPVFYAIDRYRCYSTPD